MFWSALFLWLSVEQTAISICFKLLCFKCGFFGFGYFVGVFFLAGGGGSGGYFFQNCSS